MRRSPHHTSPLRLIILLLLLQSFLPAYAFAALQLPATETESSICHNSGQPLPARLAGQDKPACPLCPLLLIGWQGGTLPDAPTVPACEEQPEPDYDEFRSDAEPAARTAYTSRAPPATA